MDKIVINNTGKILNNMCLIDILIIPLKPNYIII